MRRYSGCLAPGCTDVHKSRGWCAKHLERWKHWPQPRSYEDVRREVGLSNSRTARYSDAERAAAFWEKVDRRGPDECWLWAASTTEGYGLFNSYSSDGRRTRNKAYRFAYELLVGPIPAGFAIDHLCCVHGCVNPAHLEVVTTSENTRRQHERRRLLAAGG